VKFVISIAEGVCRFYFDNHEYNRVIEERGAKVVLQ
jgi:hypothetical protein